MSLVLSSLYNIYYFKKCKKNSSFLNSPTSKKWTLQSLLTLLITPHEAFTITLPRKLIEKGRRARLEVPPLSRIRKHRTVHSAVRSALLLFWHPRRRRRRRCAPRGDHQQRYEGGEKLLPCLHYIHRRRVAGRRETRELGSEEGSFFIAGDVSLGFATRVVCTLQEWLICFNWIMYKGTFLLCWNLWMVWLFVELTIMLRQ